MDEYEFISLDESQDGKTKYIATFMNLHSGKMKTVKFGAYGYGDYPYWYEEKGADYANKKKENYIKRHQVNEDWRNPISRGTLSLFILWNKSTVRRSLESYLKTFF